MAAGARPDAGEPDGEDGGVPTEAADEPGAEDGGPGPQGEEGRPRSFWKELPLLLVIALVLALVVKTFLVQAFSIPSGSMNDTLLQGDRVMVDKLTPWFGSGPSRGEVVVFHDPGDWLGETPPHTRNAVVRGLRTSLSFIGLMPSANEKDLIKRVIGVGGDTVSCKGAGPVTVNGKALVEPYVHPGSTACTPGRPFTVKVPEGRIWVMGDNRQNSRDSRYHMDEVVDGRPTLGTVSDKQVVGRAVAVAWPVTRWDWLGIPSTFTQPGINAAGSAAPAILGLAGAFPLTRLRRRHR